MVLNRKQGDPVMMRQKKSKGMGLLVAAMFAVALTVPIGPASASTITTLTNWNVDALDATGDTVTVDYTGTTLTFTFNYVSGPTIQLSRLKGIDEAGWQGGEGSATNWTNNPGSLDGFGSFDPDMVYGGGGGGATGVGSTISFTGVTGPGTHPDFQDCLSSSWRFP